MWGPVGAGAALEDSTTASPGWNSIAAPVGNRAGYHSRHQLWGVHPGSPLLSMCSLSTGLWPEGGIKMSSEGICPKSSISLGVSSTRACWKWLGHWLSLGKSLVFWGFDLFLFFYKSNDLRGIWFPMPSLPNYHTLTSILHFTKGIKVEPKGSRQG